MARKLSLVASAAVCWGLVSTVAFAQDKTPEASTESPAGADDQIDDIVVTAQRRAESAQKASLSVVAVSGEQLAARGASDLMNLNNLVPGLRIAYAAAQPQFYVRGVGDSTSNPLTVSSVAVNFDGIYTARGTAIGPLMFDIQRMEALRGPQGTLYGRNASGGALNIITQPASLSGTEGYVAVELGNYNLQRMQAAVNGVLSQNFAIRLSSQITRRDGYLSDGANDEDTRSFRARALWQPKDTITLQIIADMADIDGAGFGRVYRPVLFNDPWTSSKDPRITAALFPTLNTRTPYSIDTRYRGVSAQLDVDLGGPVLTIIPAYKYNRMVSNSSSDFAFTEDSTSNQKSVEARVSQSTDRLKWVLGGFFFKEDMNYFSNTDQRKVVTQTGVVARYDFPYYDTKSFAAFGEATISVTDRLRVIGGLRYTWERRSRELSRLAESYTNGVVTLTQTGTFQGNLDVSALTYRAGFEFDAARDNMLYATVSKSFKSGGFDATGPDSFSPEYLTAFTAGSKNRFANGTVQLNLEAFYWKYKDQQISFLGQDSQGVTAFITRNAGQSDIYGVDAELVWRATPNDTLTASAEYLHTKYNSFQFNVPGATPAGTLLADGCMSGGPVAGTSTFVEDCAGNRLPRAPRFSGNVRYAHKFDLANGADVTFGAQMKFASLIYLGLNYVSPNLQQEAFQMYDADLTYTAPNGKWSLQLWVRNIGNRAVYEQASNESSVPPTTGTSRGSTAAINPPRTFGGRFQINF